MRPGVFLRGTDVKKLSQSGKVYSIQMGFSFRSGRDDPVEAYNFLSISVSRSWKTRWSSVLAKRIESNG